MERIRRTELRPFFGKNQVLTRLALLIVLILYPITLPFRLVFGIVFGMYKGFMKFLTSEKYSISMIKNKVIPAIFLPWRDE